MAEAGLVSYIKQTISQGFAESEIRQALREAGWHEAEIEEGFLEIKSPQSVPAAHPVIPPISVAPLQTASQGEPQTAAPQNFFAKNSRLLIIILAILVALPILGFAGYWAYQKLGKQGETRGALTTSNEKPAERDRKRLDDIAGLQDSLQTYFDRNNYYPGSLSALGEVPTDPKSGERYLYSALGGPALHYTLGFVLEEGIGTLKAGFQNVTSEYALPTDNLKKEQVLIDGGETPQSAELEITDLSITPFYAGESVNLEIKTDLDLESVMLVMDNLELIDKRFPYSFNFSAPKTSGTYTVKVFGFHKTGKSYYQTTNLIVQVQPAQ